MHGTQHQQRTQRTLIWILALLELATTWWRIRQERELDRLHAETLESIAAARSGTNTH